MSRVKHQSRSVELHVDAPRHRVWPALVEVIESAVDIDAALSVEPPWRYCYDAAGTEPDLEFFQGTFVIRDDGPECHVSWGVVFDPEPSEAGLIAIERACERTTTLLSDLAATL